MSNHKLIDTWIQLRDMSSDSLRDKLAITEDHIATNRTYEKLTATTQWHNPATHPGHFIFQGSTLKAIYVDDESALADLDPKELTEALGQPDAQLRSRAGKRVPYHIYGQTGLAIAADSKRVYYLEIFQPMTPEEYQAAIYAEPPPYRK